jgi:hypothetical protein
MPARETMTPLITHLRDLVFDTGNPATFSDEKLERALDLHHHVIEQTSLSPVREVSVAGEVEWKVWYTPFRWWENGYRLQDGSWALVVPTLAEPLIGRWSFADSQAGPLYVSGRIYDMYAAAVTILDQWLAQLRNAYDFSTDGRSFSRSQQVTNLRDIRDQYRTKVGTNGPTSSGVVRMVRTDTLGTRTLNAFERRGL